MFSPQVSMIFFLQTGLAGARLDSDMASHSRLNDNAEASMRHRVDKPHRHYLDGECQDIEGVNTTGQGGWVYDGNQPMSEQVCYDFCRMRGNMYFATRAGKDCICFDRTEEIAGPKTCNIACEGDPAQNCGGATSWRVHLITAWVPDWEEKPCGSPPEVKHSLQTCNASTAEKPDAVCDVQCKPGHRLAVNTLLCDTTRGVWVGTAKCDEYICPAPQRISNASSMCKSARGSVNEGKCDVTCLPGFVANNTLKCTEPASSSDVVGVFVGEAVCQAAPCEMPNMYPNTNVLQVPPTFGDVVEYSCAPGFSLEGTKDSATTFTSRCQEDGTMTPVSKTCKPMKCGSAMPNIPNARPQTGVDGIEPSLNAIFFPNTTTYECVDGYVLANTSTGDKRFEVSCQDNGDWTDFPTCITVSCGTPRIVPNAVLADNVNASVALYVPEKVSYKCQEGYALDKENVENIAFELTCNMDTLYSSPPTCEKVSCGDPQGRVEDATVVFHSSEALFDDHVEYRCADGFTVTGTAGDPASVYMTCQADGSIQPSTSSESSCIKVSCNTSGLTLTKASWDAASAKHVDAGVKAFTELHYECAEFYSTDRSTALASKSGSIMCQADGRYNKRIETCKNIDDCLGHTCGPFGQCVDGLGSYSCNCSNTFPKKDEVTGEIVCGDPGECGSQACGSGLCVDLINGYKCECPSGHTLYSYNDGNDTACNPEPILCGASPIIEFATPDASKLEVGETVHYDCKVGYETPDGQTGFEVKCDLDLADPTQGKFIGADSPNHICVPVKCGHAPTPRGSNITYDKTREFVFGEAVEYTCPLGQTYSIAGSAFGTAHGGNKTFTRSCLANTHFSVQIGECKWVSCGSPSTLPGATLADSNLQALKYGQTRYHCDAGHYTDPDRPSIGNSFFDVECQESGDVDVSHGQCKPVTCMAPAVSQDGGATLSGSSSSAPVSVTVELGNTVTYVRSELGYYFLGASGTKVFDFEAACATNGQIAGIKDSHKVTCGGVPSFPGATQLGLNLAPGTPMYFKEAVAFECKLGFEMHPTVWRANGEPSNKREFSITCTPRGQFVGQHGVPAGIMCVNASICNDPLQECSVGGHGSCEFGKGKSGKKYICKCAPGYEYRIHAGYSVCQQISGPSACPQGLLAQGVCGVHGQCILSGDGYACVCNSGYQEVTTDGKQMCELKSCPNLPAVADSKMTADVPMKAFETHDVVCKKGFSVDGTIAKTVYEVTCKPDAQLTTVLPCRKVECGFAPKVRFSSSLVVKGSTALAKEEMKTRVWVYGETARYTCATGYTLNGQASGAKQLDLACQADGTFERESHCQPVDCGTPPGITNGQRGSRVQGSYPNPGYVVSYVCDTGYSFNALSHLDTSKKLKCQPDGQLAAMDGTVYNKNVDLQCLRASCGSPPAFPGSSRPSGPKYFNQKVTYTCNANMAVNGVYGGATTAESTCLPDTSFSLKTFKCQKVNVEVSGYIKDATNNNPVRNDAEVSLTDSAGLAHKTKTNSAGLFKFSGIPVGDASLEATAQSYEDEAKSLKVSSVILAGTSADMALSPTLQDHELRFVLTWGESPSDLDSHLYWGAGRGCHTYFSARHVACGGSDGVTATLDVDDTTSFGPETITVTNLQKCKDAIATEDTCSFFYKVVNFNGGGPWKTQSDAMVKVYTHSGLMGTYRIAQEGWLNTGPWRQEWHVIQIKIAKSGQIGFKVCPDSSCSGAFRVA